MTGYALWLLYATTGFRRGEALAHTRTDLQLEPAGLGCPGERVDCLPGGELTREDGAEPPPRGARQGHRGGAAGAPQAPGG
jgi:hypothetical protein